jgi:hypothetical protein
MSITALKMMNELVETLPLLATAIMKKQINYFISFIDKILILYIFIHIHKYIFEYENFEKVHLKKNGRKSHVTMQLSFLRHRMFLWFGSIDSRAGILEYFVSSSLLNL